MTRPHSIHPLVGALLLWPLLAGGQLAAAPPPNGGGAAVWPPDGHSLAFLSGTPNSPANLWAVEIGRPGAEPVQLTHLGARCLGWAPDGRALHYQTFAAGHSSIYSVTFPGGQTSPELTFLGDDVTAIAPSPDCSQVAYVRRAGNDRDLWVANWAGANPRRLTHDLPVRSVAWSPDGKRLAFDVGGIFGQACFVVEAGGGSDPLRVFSGMGNYPAWSPDGTRLALVGFHSATVVSGDGRENHRLHVSQADSGALSWSPDGKLLAYAAVKGALRDIAAVDATTGKVTSLSAGWVYAGSPRWSPDGHCLAFEAVRAGAVAPCLYLLNLRNRSLRQITESYPSSWAARRSGDGKATLFVTDEWGRADIRLVAEGGRGEAPRPLLRLDSRFPLQVSWPQGSARGIAVQGNAVWELSSSRPARKLLETEHPTSADLSPAGDELAYVKWQTHVPSLVIRRLADGTERELLSAPPIGQAYSKLAWSPRGGDIAFVRGAALCKVNIRRGSVSVLWAAPPDEGDSVILPPVWSPDGQWIAFGRFTSKPGQQLEIRAVRLLGRRCTLLARTEVFAETGLYADPLARPYDWQPGGRRIAFCAELEGLPALYVARVGREASPPVLVRKAAAYPEWSSDGRRISFTALEGNRERLSSLRAPAEGRARDWIAHLGGEELQAGDPR